MLVLPIATSRDLRVQALRLWELVPLEAAEQPAGRVLQLYQAVAVVEVVKPHSQVAPAQRVKAQQAVMLRPVNLVAVAGVQVRPAPMAPADLAVQAPMA